MPRAILRAMYLLLVAFLATVRVASVEPQPWFDEALARDARWIGADGAWSVPLGDGKVLWVFGDTLVKDRPMQRTSQGMQDGRSFAFTVPARRVERPEEEWYWPAAGCVVGERPYFFWMKCRAWPEGPPGFQFEVVAHELTRGDDVVEVPGPVLLGAAAVVDGDWLYAYGLKPGAERSLYVARIPLSALRRLDMSAWTYWTAAGWGAGDPVPLIPDGATEMSVTRVQGLPGFYAVYTPNGLGGDIFLRQAARPEGPWSEPICVYRAPEADRGMLVYGAKAHPEQAWGDGDLFVTYNCNLADFQELLRRPQVYRPRAVLIHLEGSSGGPCKPPAPVGGMLRIVGDRSS